MVKYRINERIAATKVQLILPSGENKGEVAKSYALEQARQLGLDLVEVSTGTVPVCKILDHGKMLYQQSKQNKHKSHHPSPKEMRFNFNIGQHDIDIKKRKISEFLSDGHHVICSMIVKGREKYVSGGVAKTKFFNIVKEISPVVKIADIRDSERGFTVTVKPDANSKNEDSTKV